VDVSVFSLSARADVITGASRDIGAAVSMWFAAAGADVVLVTRDEQRLTAHGAALRSGRRVVEVAVDTGAPQAAEMVAEAAASQLPGPVDILMNNAYDSAPDLIPLVETSESLWRTWSVNLLGVRPRSADSSHRSWPQPVAGRLST